MRLPLCSTILLLGLLCWGSACSSPTRPSAAPLTLTQVSAIDALLAGGYDGQRSLSELHQYGDLGIGTFHALDGEMILLDGVFYQARADGHIYRPDLRTTTPFASVVPFRAESTTTLPHEVNLDQLSAAIDALQPSRNTLCVFRVQGTFRQIKVRSVPAQQKPYPPLVEVTKTQPVFDYTDRRGTLIGFRTPPFVKGLNVPGYHLHFLSDDRQVGGHVLAFTLVGGTLELSTCNRFDVLLPAEAASLAGLDLTKDRTKELEKAEK